MGKPLLHYSISKLIKSNLFSEIVLTTDSKKIINKCKKFKKLHIINRPKKLASSRATSESVVLHVLNNLKENFDLVILIEPTAPLISEETLNHLISIFKFEKKTNIVFCIKKITNSYGNFNGKHFSFNKNQARRRQDREPIFLEGFGVYGVRTDYFIKFKKLYNKKVRAILLDDIETLDINNKFDLFLFESILKNYSNFKKFK